MQNLNEQKHFDFIGKGPAMVAISCLLVVIAIAFMFINKSQTGNYFNLSIHYTGGESLLLHMSEAMPIDGQEVKRIVEKYADGEPIVQVYADDPQKVAIKMRIKAEGTTEDELSRARTEALADMKEELGNSFGGYSAVEGELNPETLEQQFVGPTVGAELIRNTLYALIIGCLLIMIYIFYRFGRWPMSIAAIVALVHDVMIALGVAAVFRLEVSDSFIAVVLTIIGFSINDTIIIFDRIRENLQKYGEDADLRLICNVSLSQTLMRSLNTTFTLLLTIGALLIWGGANLKPFLWTMFGGMIAGAYSSVFIAAPIMLWITKGRANQLAAAPAGSGASMPLSVPPADFPGDVAAAGAERPRKKQARRR